MSDRTSNIFAFEGVVPVVDPTAFVHPNATVTGDVWIGKHVYVGPGAAIRGDWGRVIIKDGCNVQESCTIHMFPGVTVILEEGAHMGHGAIVHGAHVGANSLIGMNAVVMDDVRVGENCIIGALCFVPNGMQIPDRKVVVGNPAKIVKDVTDEQLRWKTDGTKIYQGLPARCHQTLTPVAPLSEASVERDGQRVPLVSNTVAPWKRSER